MIETVARRVQRLVAEAKALARDDIANAIEHLELARRRAVEVSEGGEAYPAGVRDLMARTAEEMEARINTASALMGRGL